MTIEEQLLEATAALSGLTAERDDLRATVEKLTVGSASELEALKVEAAAKDSKIAELSAIVEAASKDAKLAELTAALEVAAKEVEGFKAMVASLEASKVNASKEAAKIVASVGVSPVEISPADSKPSAEAVDHLATFLSLPVGSKERNAYFAEHRNAIVKACI